MHVSFFDNWPLTFSNYKCLMRVSLNHRDDIRISIYFFFFYKIRNWKLQILYIFNILIQYIYYFNFTFYKDMLQINGIWVLILCNFYNFISKGSYTIVTCERILKIQTHNSILSTYATWPNVIYVPFLTYRTRPKFPHLISTRFLHVYDPNFFIHKN